MTFGAGGVLVGFAVAWLFTHPVNQRSKPFNDVVQAAGESLFTAQSGVKQSNDYSNKEPPPRIFPPWNKSRWSPAEWIPKKVKPPPPDDGRPPCKCISESDEWVRYNRTKLKKEPRCLFIDLGANDGNSFEFFLGDWYIPLADCPGGRWEAILVEAHPVFDKRLQEIEKLKSPHVTAMTSTAAFNCEESITFNTDVKGAEHYQRSSIGRGELGGQVTVPMVNVLRLIYENASPEDMVILKMDIEGAEFDIIPCLVNFPDAELIDRFFVEIHWKGWSLYGNGKNLLQASLDNLRARGVEIPSDYFTAT